MAKRPSTASTIDWPQTTGVTAISIALLAGSIQWVISRERAEAAQRRNRAIIDHRDRAALEAGTLIFDSCEQAWGEGSNLCGTETGIALSAPPNVRHSLAQAVADACAAHLSAAFPTGTWTVDIQADRVVVASASTVPHVPKEVGFPGPSPYGKSTNADD